MHDVGAEAAFFSFVLCSCLNTYSGVTFTRVVFAVFSMDSALSFLKKAATVAASEAQSIGGKLIDRASKVAGDVQKMTSDLPTFELEGVAWQSQKALGTWSSVFGELNSRSGGR